MQDRGARRRIPVPIERFVDQGRVAAAYNRRPTSRPGGIVKTGTLCRQAWIATALACIFGAACGGDDDTDSADAGAAADAAGTADAGDTGDADAGAGTDAAADPLATTGGFVGPRSGRAPSTRRALPPASPFHALQLNLCNSGYASCFEDGQSIPEAHEVIVQVAPHLVTLNEICEDDVAAELLPAMREVWPDDYVFWVFAPAGSRGSGGPIQCTDGQRYGVGILGHVPAASWEGFEFIGNRLSNQDEDQDEMRAWACARATGNYFGCVTHLENDNGDVAMLQCQELMNPIVPQFWGESGGPLPTVVGGDFNLTFRGNPDIQDCVPPAWYRKGDGDVQHIFATDDLTFDSSELIPLETSDHDAWLVRTITP
jgi:hypothetical protein